MAPGNEHLANIIVEETTRLDRIVREFLDFARPREGNFKMASLNDVVDRVVSFIGPEMEKNGIEFEKHIQAGIPAIMMDSEQIYQAVFNIVFNAVQAMDSGGNLSVSTGVTFDHSFVELRVKDTGPGINVEKVDQIFTPFYTEKNKGTGLGLSIAKSIVEKHEGTITVESNDGQGCLFILTLPVMKEQA